MDALRLLCLLAIPFYVAEQIAGQSNWKLLGSWSISSVDRYPKPLENDSKCNVDCRPMRICDPNRVIEPISRNAANDHLNSLQNSTFKSFDQFANCPEPGFLVVAILKSIDGEAHDKGKEAVGIAEKLHKLWKLNNCSAVFVVSGDDKAGGLFLGDALEQHLPSLNTTIGINTTSSTCITGNKFQGSVLTLMLCFREAFIKEIGDKITEHRTTEAPTGPKPNGAKSPDPEDKNELSSADSCAFTDCKHSPNSCYVTVAAIYANEP